MALWTDKRQASARLSRDASLYCTVLITVFFPLHGTSDLNVVTCECHVQKDRCNGMLFQSIEFPAFFLLLNRSAKILERKKQVQKEVEELKATLAKVILHLSL